MRGRCDNCNKLMKERETGRADNRSQFIWFCDECAQANADPDRRAIDRYMPRESGHELRHVLRIWDKEV